MPSREIEVWDTDLEIREYRTGEVLGWRSKDRHIQYRLRDCMEKGRASVKATQAKVSKFILDASWKQSGSNPHYVTRPEHVQIRSGVFNMLTNREPAREIYRLSIAPQGTWHHNGMKVNTGDLLMVKVETVGVNLLGNLDQVEEGWYTDVTELPMWMQEKYAVLSILDPNETPSATLPDIGRRISDNVFWVFAPQP